MDKISIIKDDGRELSVEDFLEIGPKTAVAAHCRWLLVRSDRLPAFVVSICDITGQSRYTPMQIDAMRSRGESPKFGDLGWTYAYDAAERRAKYAGNDNAHLGTMEQWSELIRIGSGMKIPYRVSSLDGPIYVDGNYNALFVILGGDPVGTKPYWVQSPDDGSDFVDTVEVYMGEVQFRKRSALERNRIFAKKFQSYIDLNITTDEEC